MAGGTFTITNVGVFGVDTGTPILQPGRGRDPRLRRGAGDAVGAQGRARGPSGRPRSALSFDHRIIDGELGSQFLADIAAFLTDPGLALAFG